MVADFAPPRGNVATRILENIYYRIANVFFWILRLMAIHPVYDYSRYFPGLGLELQSVKDFGVSRLGLYVYRSIVATRVLGKE